MLSPTPTKTEVSYSLNTIHTFPKKKLRLDTDMGDFFGSLGDTAKDLAKNVGRTVEDYGRDVHYIVS